MSWTISRWSEPSSTDRGDEIGGTGTGLRLGHLTFVGEQQALLGGLAEASDILIGAEGHDVLHGVDGHLSHWLGIA